MNPQSTPSPQPPADTPHKAAIEFACLGMPLAALSLGVLLSPLKGYGAVGSFLSLFILAPSLYVIVIKFVREYLRKFYHISLLVLAAAYSLAVAVLYVAIPGFDDGETHTYMLVGVPKGGSVDTFFHSLFITSGVFCLMLPFITLVLLAVFMTTDKKKQLPPPAGSVS